VNNELCENVERVIVCGPESLIVIAKPPPPLFPNETFPTKSLSDIAKSPRDSMPPPSPSVKLADALVR